MKSLLVTGFVRSGTTFLANFLNAQKDCLVYRDFLNSIFRTPKSLGVVSYKEELTDRQKNIILSELKAEGWSIGTNVLDQISKDFFSLNELHKKVLTLLKDSHSYKVVGNKTTILGGDLKTLLEETDIHIIYIYRDFRDVILSAKNRFRNFNLTRMLIDLEKDLKESLKLTHKRLLKIHFEELMNNTDITIKKISLFLDIPIVKDVRVAKDRQIDWINNSSFHDIKAMFDKQACYRWRKEKDSKEVKYCEIILKDFLNEAGYGLNKHKYGFLDKLSVNNDYYYEKFKNFGRRILSKKKSS